MSYERRGRYEEARRQLEILVAANSAHHEGRVRLAVLLRRMGQPAAAERMLLEIIAEQPPEWLLSLAYQTLAQLLGRQDRYAEAIVQLERSRRRLPGDQALGLMLAYALDRDGRRQAAAAQLRELPPARAGRTARYRYSDEPAAALGLLHDTVRQSVAVRLPLLGRVLADGVAAGPAP